MVSKTRENLIKTSKFISCTDFFLFYRFAYQCVQLIKKQYFVTSIIYLTYPLKLKDLEQLRKVLYSDG